MKEFLLLIRVNGNPVEELSPQQLQQHVEKVGSFIKGQMDKGVMKTTNPLEMTGAVIFGNKEGITDGPFAETKEVIAGYYLIEAASLEDAVEIAKMDPRFEDGEWRIDVRPIMKVDGIN